MTNRVGLALALALALPGTAFGNGLLFHGCALVVETGLNFSDQPIWWRQIIPGPSGLADAPQMRIEQQVGPPLVFAVIHDEQGSVIGIASDDASVTGVPLRARVFYSPYGEAHVETGPELLHVKFDPGLTAVGGQTQSLPPPVPPATVSANTAGGVRIATTIPFDPSSFSTGLLIARWDGTNGQWVTVDLAGFAIANADQSSDDAELDLMPLAGFPKGERYRITLKPALHDGFGRSLQIPTGEPPSGVELALDIPQGEAIPSLDREWKLAFDTLAAATTTLDGTVPGGFNLLFQGMWTDPTTGLALTRYRWYDARNATYLDEDPDAADTDSLYAFASGAPHMGGEPAFGAAIPDVSWAEGIQGGPWGGMTWGFEPAWTQTSGFQAADWAIGRAAGAYVTAALTPARILGAAASDPVGFTKSMVHYDEIREGLSAATDPRASLSERFAGSGVVLIGAVDVGVNFLAGGGEGAALEATQKALVKEIGESGLREAVEAGVHQAGQAAIRQRVLANIAESQWARSHSRFAAYRDAERMARNAPVVVGENMTRVNSYARGIFGYTIDDWLAGRQWSQELNDEFITTMKSQGREFIDIGPDFGRRLRNRLNSALGRPPSAVYGGERRQLLNYARYRRVYERGGRYQGGVPGFDF